MPEALESTGSIAIIGMGGIYPGAHTPEELWQNVLAGRRYFRRLPDERLPRADYYDADPQAPGKTYLDQLSVIADWHFDPLEFRIPPVTINASDITHWLALYTAKRTLEDAGLRLEAIDRSRVGVILGNSLVGEFARSHQLRFRWPYVERAIRRVADRNSWDPTQTNILITAVKQSYESPLPEITEDSLAGNMSNTIAGRICNYFDFGAGGYTVDGACSSSLLSVVHACNALINDDMDFALAGGVDVSLDPFEVVGFAKTNALAKDDIRPYDERAGGMITGEGCGIFLLMREQDARDAGFTIHALIRGWGISSDGAGGITEPILEGQVRALKHTYQRAGYPISTVSLIEGHGTGTPLGDKVEISALQQLLDDSGGHGLCWLGSIKGNVGHCKAAAGAAGLTKVVMALKRKILPPTVNCERPNPLFQRSNGRLRPITHGGTWPQDQPQRRAAVSSMGFGGANAHVTLEEVDPNEPPSVTDLSIIGSDQPSELILLCGADCDQLQSQIDKLIPTVDRISRAELTDLAAALTAEATSGNTRLALVARSPWALADALRRVSARLADGAEVAELDDPDGDTFAGTCLDNPAFVALFPGQGSQRLNMGEHLVSRYPFVRKLYDQADEALADILPGGLQSIILRDPRIVDAATKDTWEAEVRETRIAQPAIVLSSIATLKVLEFFGLKPALTLGHSLGEICALHAAGMYDASTSLRMAALRGHAMATLDLKDNGAMVAVGASPEIVEKLIEPFGQMLVISNYNSPKQTVVSGTSAAITDFLRICLDTNTPCQRLPVSHAFHSDIVAPSTSAFRKALDGLSFNTTHGTAISTSTGNTIGTGAFVFSSNDHTLATEANLKQLLSEQIRKPVRFTDAVTTAAQTAPTLWVEVGPGGVLTHLARDILGPGAVDCMPTDLPGENGHHLLNRVLARAYVQGFPIALDRLFAHRFYRPFPLKDYNPTFIVNPCERPEVEIVTDVSLPEQGLTSELLPSAVDAEERADYLSRRGQFIRELVALDYAHFGGASIPSKIDNEDQATRYEKERGVEATRNEPEEIAPTKNEVVGEETRVPLPSVPWEQQQATLDKDSLLAYVIDWIANRTGFPADSIAPDMKLRDDLNLDSIKVGELVVTMSRKLGSSTIFDPASAANTRLSELVDTLFATDKAQSTGPSSGEVDLSLQFDLTDWVRTFEVQTVSATLEAELSLAALSAEEQAVIVAEAGCPRAETVASSLTSLGLRASVTDLDSLLAGDESSADLRVLILILPEIASAFFDGSLEEFDSRVEGLATTLFRLFQWVRRGRSHDLSNLRGLILRPSLGTEDRGTDLDAGAAFLKSLCLEYPGLCLKWIVLPSTWSETSWAEQVAAELETFSGCGPFTYTDQGTRLTNAALPMSEPSDVSPSLTNDDVVVASGGGKGITCELALALGKLTGVKIAILGTSPLPSDSSGPEDTTLLQNLRRYEEAGIPYCYLQCDVTDYQAVSNTVAKIERQLGPISGILHGAGISELALFSEKRLDDFLRCVRVKARGLFGLLSAIAPSQLKFLHVISSVLGYTGMRTQTDYTFSNAWLDGALCSLQQTYPRLQCLSFAYSVWSETGLGIKIGALEGLKTLGVSTISIRDGVDAYLQLTQHRWPCSAFVITGRLTTDLEDNLFGSNRELQGRFLEHIRRWVPGTEIVADATLSHATDLYLPEHVFDGTPLFPGVMAVEAFIEAARTCTGRNDLPVLRDIRFQQPLIVPEDSSVIMRTFAVAEQKDGRMTKVMVTVRSSTDGFHSNHFAAECIYDSEPGVTQNRPTAPPITVPLPVDLENFHPSPLFQGRFFRRITAIHEMDEGKVAVTSIRVPEGECYYADVTDLSLVMPSPAVHDAFLQSVALILPAGYLPDAIAEMRFYRLLQPGTEVLCQVSVVQTANDTVTANINVFLNGGELAETISGIVLRTSSEAQQPSQVPVIVPTSTAIPPTPTTTVSAAPVATPVALSVYSLNQFRVLRISSC